MVTVNQEKACEKLLREYRKQYLTKKENLNADESTARLMVNSLLNTVLGYTLIDEIKTEHMIRGTYADYVIQLNKKIHFIVEVKATSIDLNERHLKQAVDYAANEGVDWVILTNGRSIELYRVIFEKPIRSQRIFSYDLTNLSTIRTASRHLAYLTKRAILKGELDVYWRRFDALTDDNIRKAVLSPEVVKALRLQIKRKSNINFSDNEVAKALGRLLDK
jgi:predicted type IV restriction endonuclease|nr:MAG TPA: type I restriction enzyme R protein [Caudoviricetes sp.]DAR37428.1 MAG TPA: type I restriction enzyme R protein [Caudoviricetes sp.]